MFNYSNYVFFVKPVEFMIHEKIGFRLTMHLRFFSTACKMAFFMIVKVTDASSREKQGQEQRKRGGTSPITWLLV